MVQCRHAPLVRQSTTTTPYFVPQHSSSVPFFPASFDRWSARKETGIWLICCSDYIIDFIPPPPNYWLTSSSPPFPSGPPSHPLPITLRSWIVVSSFNGRNNSLNWISLAPNDCQQQITHYNTGLGMGRGLVPLVYIYRWTEQYNACVGVGLNILCRQISEILTTFTFRFPGFIPNAIPFPFYNPTIWLLVDGDTPCTAWQRVEFIVKWGRQIHPCSAIKVIIMERYYFVKVMAAPRIMSWWCYSGGFPLPNRRTERSSVPFPSSAANPPRLPLLLLRWWRWWRNPPWEKDVAYLSAKPRSRWICTEGCNGTVGGDCCRNPRERDK